MFHFWFEIAIFFAVAEATAVVGSSILSSNPNKRLMECVCLCVVPFVLGAVAAGIVSLIV